MTVQMGILPPIMSTTLVGTPISPLRFVPVRLLISRRGNGVEGGGRFLIMLGVLFDLLFWCFSQVPLLLGRSGTDSHLARHSMMLGLLFDLLFWCFSKYLSYLGVGAQILINLCSSIISTFALPSGLVNSTPSFRGELRELIASFVMVLNIRPKGRTKNIRICTGYKGLQIPVQAGECKTTFLSLHCENWWLITLC